MGGGSNGQISVPPGLFMASADDVVVDDDRTKDEIELIVEALLLAVVVETTKEPTDGMDTRTVPIVHTPSFIVVMESGFPSLFLVTLCFGKSLPFTSFMAAVVGARKAAISIPAYDTGSK